MGVLPAAAGGTFHAIGAIMILHAIMLTLAAAPPGAMLTPAQKSALTRAVICPERLRNDAARIRNVDLFFNLYARFQPESHAGERMAYRDVVLREKHCKPQDKGLIHTFPET
jgi:hypothetical protein